MLDWSFLSLQIDQEMLPEQQYGQPYDQTQVTTPMDGDPTFEQTLNDLDSGVGLDADDPQAAQGYSYNYGQSQAQGQGYWRIAYR